MNKPEAYFEINEIVSRLLEIQKNKEFNFGNAMLAVLNTPTINIVRCKNCKYCNEWDNYDPPQYICSMWTDQWDMSTEPNGFCHYGEIKIEI